MRHAVEDGFLVHHLCDFDVVVCCGGHFSWTSHNPNVAEFVAPCDRIVVHHNGGSCPARDEIVAKDEEFVVCVPVGSEGD